MSILIISNLPKKWKVNQIKSCIHGNDFRNIHFNEYKTKTLKGKLDKYFTFDELKLKIPQIIGKNNIVFKCIKDIKGENEDKNLKIDPLKIRVKKENIFKSLPIKKEIVKVKVNDGNKYKGEQSRMTLTEKLIFDKKILEKKLKVKNLEIKKIKEENFNNLLQMKKNYEKQIKTLKNLLSGKEDQIIYLKSLIK